MPHILCSVKNKGFTIIELIVVMAVFLFIIGAAIGIFISIVQHQKRVLAEQQILNQISYVEEYMSKALRMAKAETSEGCLNADNPGYIYLLTRYDLALQTFRGIKFLNQSEVDSFGNPLCQEFFLDNSDPANVVLKELKNSTNSSNAVAITSKSLKINFVKFSINGSGGSTFTSDSCPSTMRCGASSADLVQPRVTVLLNVSIPGDSQGVSRTIQTTVSQRNIVVAPEIESLGDVGDPCDSATDCQSGYCSGAYADTPYICTDGDYGDACTYGYDCSSRYCDTYYHRCTSGEDGSGCGRPEDCQSNYCENNICVPSPS